MLHHRHPVQLPTVDGIVMVLLYALPVQDGTALFQAGINLT
jgi:hypothetical protein